MPSTIVALVAALCSSLPAQWKLLPQTSERTPLPKTIPADAKDVAPGDKLPEVDKYQWLMADLTIPEEVQGKPVSGKPLALRFNACGGGAVYVDGALRARYDNDHPALVPIADPAQPGEVVRVAAQLYAKVQGGADFGEASWTLIDPARARKTLDIHVDAKNVGEPVPDGLVGLSQGGGLSDYETATAEKLKEARFRWFRMDNVFTPVVSEKNGEYHYDWDSLDKRVDFCDAIGADFILCASYMPIPFDAVENHDRQSAPKDYDLWADLCYRAAKRSIDRGKRIPFWEVWNEVNTGWLKPGPDDDGDEYFKKLYAEGRGEEQFEHDVIRRFEAYCKLYRATVEGVRRADPDAKFGGPALASGPFEHKDCGHCFHGQGFAKGLMLYCAKEDLPLDFVSWHEYFHPWEVYRNQVQAFRKYLKDVPEAERQVKSFMITEWNEAWWANRPMDHEVGAAYSANCITRAFIPYKIDRPCFFYVKQNDMNFRGDFSMLMANNIPKASFNVLKIFNNLSGKWLNIKLDDPEVSAVAAWDADRKRLAVVLVNYQDRYVYPRNVKLGIDQLPESIRKGSWRRWLIDATHSNVWHDVDNAELQCVDRGSIRGASHELSVTLEPNSVTLLELTAEAKPE